MSGRPSRRVIALEVAALAIAGAVAMGRNGYSNWDVSLLAVLLIAAVLGDLTAVDTPASRVKLSSSFLVIVIAVVFLGETPAAVVAVTSILAGWLRFRYSPTILLNNLVTYAWFPLLSGIAFDTAREATDAAPPTDGVFYLLVLGLFVLALMIDFVLIASYFCYVEGSRFSTKVRRALVPVLPSELASALVAVGIAYMYAQFGLATLGLLAVALIIFQYLIGALLVSQQRADELELRAKQLAGFQVALLGALLRTLDLRDRMTARHSAAVARYAREIAGAAGLSSDEQELAHAAGLLHDIGKFVWPDRILKSDARLTAEDWDVIRTHPSEGARIVSQVDGYQPIGDVILAHHERPDGLGY